MGLTVNNKDLSPFFLLLKNSENMKILVERIKIKLTKGIIKK